MATKLKVDPREFVVAWQMSDDIQEVKAHLGLQNEPNRFVSARASSFRKNGVQLKRMRNGTRYDYVALAEIAAWAVGLADQGEERDKITVDRFLRERGDSNGDL